MLGKGELDRPLLTIKHHKLKQGKKQTPN